MSDEKPIKSASNEFTKDSFYLIQTKEKDKRYVISLKEKNKILELFSIFIDNIENDFLEIKVCDFRDYDETIIYSGAIKKEMLNGLITEYQDVIFHNGYHDFMMRNPDSGEVLAFDDHGLCFIYSKKKYEEILLHMKISYRPNEPLIFEFNHWHYCLANGNEKLLNFINALGLVEEN